MTETSTSNTSTNDQPIEATPPFARLGRWLDMFDEIRATEPEPKK